MSKSTKRKHKQQFIHPPEIERFIEWQEKQYLPGTYAAGRMPRISVGKQPDPWFGRLLLGLGGVTLLGCLLVTWSFLTTPFVAKGLMPPLLLGGLGAILIFAGLKFLRKPLSENGK